MSWLEGGMELLVSGEGDFSMLLTDPSSSSSSVTLTIKVIGLVMASVFVFYYSIPLIKSSSGCQFFSWNQRTGMLWKV